MMKARLAATLAAALLAMAGTAQAAPVSLRQPAPVPPAQVPPHAVPEGGVPPQAVFQLPTLAEDARAPQPAASEEAPLHKYLIGAGQYVLEVGTLSEAKAPSSTVSDVPLPGAVWLFGSALLAFLAISSRRKL